MICTYHGLDDVHTEAEFLPSLVVSSLFRSIGPNPTPCNFLRNNAVHQAIYSMFIYIFGMAANSCWQSARTSHRDGPSPMAVVAFAVADWCLRLHGWPIIPPLLGVYDFTAVLPPTSPTGVLAVTPPARLAYYAAVVGRLRLHYHRGLRLVYSSIRLVGHTAVVGRLLLHRLVAFVAADWCLCLHDWLISSPLTDDFVPTSVSFVVIEGNTKKLSHYYFILYMIFSFSSASLHQLVRH
uniref:HGWP repeat containing protein-like n=1 Tax=Oryza sativa subsp. japonica TaxID=39947 RepID=Q6ZCX5_ORYSJ|nr:hypothetical protein [Oryza sativa Japonica Group]BAC99530.1 hypothetical protein [Oryza sativa Japonica Group]